MSVLKYLQSAGEYFNFIRTHPEQLKFNFMIKLVQFDGAFVKFHCNKTECLKIRNKMFERDRLKRKAISSNLSEDWSLYEH
jgi:hypothetical protein